jgi:hypothetical protein
MSKNLKVLILITIMLLSACKAQNEANLEQDVAVKIMTAAAATVQAADFTPEPSPTETDVSPPASPVPTIKPAYMVQALVANDTLNLRAGPGTLFSILQNYPKSTHVTTLEMTPDGWWIKVAAPGAEGWMAAEYLDLSALEAALPILTQPEANMIYGTVLDTQNNPVSGVRIAAIIGDQRTETVSTHSGEFFIYAPTELTGPFSFEIVALNCGSSIAEVQPDGSCLAVDYFPVDWQETVTLPQTQPIRFEYERGIAFLEGKVVYQDGNGASQILVRATRKSDNVQSEFVTQVGGEFRLPLGEGEWEVVAVRFLQDGTPLISETRSYQITAFGQEIAPLTIPYIEIIDRN